MRYYDERGSVRDSFRWVMCFAALIALCAPAGLHAQALPDSQRMVLATGTTCHAQPDAAAAAAERYHVGDVIHASKWTQSMGRRTWYFDQWRVKGISPACWIDGRLTVPFD